MRTSPAGTSRSTRWPVRSRAASSSIPWRTARRRRAHDRAVSQGVFEADPLRLLRAVRLEDELGFRIDAEAERLVRRHAELASQPAGERILGELRGGSPPPATGASRSWACSTPWAARRSCSTGSTSLTHPSTDSCACSGSRCGGCRSRAASTGTAARCSPPSHRPTLTACDPSLPARDRAVGPRRARLRRAPRASPGGRAGPRRRSRSAAASR